MGQVRPGAAALAMAAAVAGGPGREASASQAAAAAAPARPGQATPMPLPTPSPAPTPDPPDVVVNGVRDVVVNGRARRCRPVPGDPLGRITLSTLFLNGPLQQSVVKPDRHGGYVLQPDDEPVTGPDVWQRAGRGLDEYVYRVTTPDQPMCIGGNQPDRGAFAQFRRIVDARPYRGRRLRFTAWVASGQAALVNFWLAAGLQTQVLDNGGNTNNRYWGGNHGWTPVMIEIGPISRHATQISYGFLLNGPGDVWVYKPELASVAPDDPLARKGNVSVFGRSER